MAADLLTEEVHALAAERDQARAVLATLKAADARPLPTFQGEFPPEPGTVDGQLAFRESDRAPFVWVEERWRSHPLGGRWLGYADP